MGSSCAICKDDITFEPRIFDHALSRFTSRRDSIVRYIRDMMQPCYRSTTPLYRLLGTDIGDRLALLYAKITGDSMHVFDWPEEYARSSRWIWDNPESSFEEYTLFAESIGESNIYTREEFLTVWELRRLTAGTFDLE